MTGRGIRITSRIAFIVCGLTSLSTCVPYVMMRGAELPVQSEWVVFAVVLALVGVLSVGLAVLPRSWILRAFRKVRDDDKAFLSLLKLLGYFAGIFYLVAVAAYVAPNSWNLNPQLMFLLCPMYFIKMTFDPSLVAILFLLAPMNAAVYGSIGLTLAYAWLVFSRRRSR